MTPSFKQVRVIGPFGNTLPFGAGRGSDDRRQGLSALRRFFRSRRVSGLQAGRSPGRLGSFARIPPSCRSPIGFVRANSALGSPLIGFVRANSAPARRPSPAILAEMGALHVFRPLHFFASTCTFIGDGGRGRGRFRFRWISLDGKPGITGGMLVLTSLDPCDRDADRGPSRRSSSPSAPVRWPREPGRCAPKPSSPARGAPPPPRSAVSDRPSTGCGSDRTCGHLRTSGVVPCDYCCNKKSPVNP